MIGITCGSIRCAWKRSSDQPLPYANRSSETSSPHARRRLAAHSLAASVAGVPVTRGPYTSLSQLTVSIACDRSSPSAVIARITAGSGRWARRAGWAARTKAASTTRRARSTKRGLAIGTAESIVAFTAVREDGRRRRAGSGDRDREGAGRLRTTPARPALLGMQPRRRR